MKETKNGAKILKGMIFGAVAAIGAMLILCVLGGVLLSKEAVPESIIGYMGWIICAIAAWIGCWLAQRKAGCARLPVSLGCGGLLLLSMLLIGSLKQDHGSLTWYSAAIVALCAVVSALLGSGKRNRYR